MSEYRQQQCEKVLQAIVGQGRVMSRKDIADLLGIKKGRHLNGIIDELLSRMLIGFSYTADEHGRMCYVYFTRTED